MRRSVARSKLRGPAELIVARRTAAPKRGHPEVAVRFPESGSTLQRGAEFRDRLLELPLSHVRNPEVVVYVGDAGWSAGRAGNDRRPHPACPRRAGRSRGCNAPRDIREQAERPFVGRFPPSPRRPFARSTVARLLYGRRVVRRERDSHALMALRLVQTPCALQRGAEIELGDGRISVVERIGRFATARRATAATDQSRPVLDRARTSSGVPPRRSRRT